VFYASLVAFSGSDANYLKTQPNPRMQNSFSRNDVRRRDAGVRAAPSYRQRFQISETEEHESAPTLGEKVLKRRCARELTRGTRRWNNCMNEAEKGITYQFTSFTR